MAGRKGAIAFGLVYIPVELFTATQDDAVRFNQLAKDTMKRVRYVKTCPDCKRELKPEDIVKGYQYEKGKYVVVDDEELDAIKTDADRAMKIVQFSDIDEVPPLYFEKPYQVVAQPGGEKALELLRRAMVDEGKIAIGTTVLGNSETPIALIPHDDDLVMMTLHYQSEVKDVPKTLQHPDVADEELSMAKQLVESMTAPFDPSRFRNTYQEKLMQLIQDKIAGKQIVAESQEAQPSNIINLMDALSASLKARDGKDGESKKPAPAKKPRASGRRLRRLRRPDSPEALSVRGRPFGPNLVHEPNRTDADRDADDGARQDIGGIVHVQVEAREGDEACDGHGRDLERQHASALPRQTAQRRGSGERHHGVVRGERIARRRRDEQTGELVGDERPCAPEQRLQHEHAEDRGRDDGQEYGYAPPAVPRLRDEHGAGDEPHEGEVSQMRGQQHDLVEQRRAQMLLDGVENGDIHARLLRAGRA